MSLESKSELVSKMKKCVGCGHDAPYRCEMCLEYFCIDDMYLCCKICHRTFACHSCGFYVREKRLTCKDHRMTDPENCLAEDCLCREGYETDSESDTEIRLLDDYFSFRVGSYYCDHCRNDLLSNMWYYNAAEDIDMCMRCAVPETWTIYPVLPPRREDCDGRECSKDAVHKLFTPLDIRFMFADQDINTMQASLYLCGACWEGFPRTVMRLCLRADRNENKTISTVLSSE